MRVVAPDSSVQTMRRSLTRDGLRDLMKELARSAPRRGSFKVYIVGGGTAALNGWMDSTGGSPLLRTPMMSSGQEPPSTPQHFQGHPQQYLSRTKRLSVNGYVSRHDLGPLLGTERRPNHTIALH